jgi:Raf kinase inhibitor-like YbhB/YbcL family protein
MKFTHWLAVLGVLASSAVNAAQQFTITSSVAPAMGKIPVMYTCDGKNISPPIAWQGAPDNTKVYALIVADPDAPAGTFYHWVLYNIPKTVTNIPANSSPTNTLIGDNSAHQPGYHGPCPPSGTHRYIFTIYALDEALPLQEEADAQTVMQAMEKHVLGKAEYTMVFNR